MAAGILASRILGLVRNRVFAHYFGTSAAADAFNAAFRIPNVLQNLFGEGVLSASFIPVYARLLGERRDAEADRVAGAVAGLLALVTALLVALGILLTPVLIAVIAPGFEGEKRELTILLVRILFPGAGLLVMSAWCLGVLNSHRRFLLSYLAPVAWNVVIIAALLAFGDREAQSRLAVIAALASVAGSALQFGVQLPAVLRLARGVRPHLDTASEHVRTVVRSFGPVVAGRGVVQVSAYIDTLLASLLPTGAVAAVSYAQILYTLPVSLFGMSVAAAELPAMSQAGGSGDERAAELRARLGTGLRQIAYFVVPSAMVFLALGDVVVAALYQTGEFTPELTRWVWAILAGSAVGLLAATLGRLYSSAYYALGDTRTPLRFAVVRVVLALGLGYALAVPLPPALGLDPRWGAAGLTLAAGLAAWVEYRLLRGRLVTRIGAVGLPVSYAATLWAIAGVAAAAAWGLRTVLPVQGPIGRAIFLLGTFGALYLGGTLLAGLPEATRALGRLARTRRRSA